MLQVRKDHGIQPLDGILNELKLSNSDVVDASTRQLTHKMVQKGRKGRRLTAHIRNKIIEAVNALHPEREYLARDLFNY